MKKFLVFALTLLTGFGAFAQKPNLTNSIVPVQEKPLDGSYRKGNLIDAKVTPLANIREADVMYSKRVWRIIDLREKSNRAYASPKARLIDVIMGAVMAGELTAYANNTTGIDTLEFSTILKPKEVMARFTDSVLVPVLDSTGQTVSSHMEAGSFNPDSIYRFQIKEDFIFDKQRSVGEYRIVSIAPMVKVHAGGEDLGEVPAFWIYFPEARHIFVTKEVVSAHNDAIGLSYDDIFLKKLYTAYVIKESNNDDLRIKDYAVGIDRLYESERIKKALMDWEHDLWSY